MCWWTATVSVRDSKKRSHPAGIIAIRCATRNFNRKSLSSQASIGNKMFAIAKLRFIFLSPQLFEPQKSFAGQSVSGPNSQSISHAVNQPVNQSVSQSASKPASQSVSQSVNQKSLSQSVSQSARQSVSVCASRPGPRDYLYKPCIPIGCKNFNKKNQVMLPKFVVMFSFVPVTESLNVFDYDTTSLVSCPNNGLAAQAAFAPRVANAKLSASSDEWEDG